MPIECYGWMTDKVTSGRVKIVHAIRPNATATSLDDKAKVVPKKYIYFSRMMLIQPPQLPGMKCVPHPEWIKKEFYGNFITEEIIEYMMYQFATDRSQTVTDNFDNFWMEAIRSISHLAIISEEVKRLSSSYSPKLHPFEIVNRRQITRKQIRWLFPECKTMPMYACLDYVRDRI